MVAVSSTMLPLGTPAPDFRLPDTDGKLVSLRDFQDAPALLVMFICNHCPYVQHIRSALAVFAREYQARGLAIVAINSNDVASYPDDRPEKMAEEKEVAGYTFPYLFDESQEVARAYRAACTPDFYLFDRDPRLVYRGQFDDSRPGSGRPVTGADLRAAVDAVLAGRSVPKDRCRSATEPRLQHQVEARQRPGVLRRVASIGQEKLTTVAGPRRLPKGRSRLASECPVSRIPCGRKQGFRLRSGLPDRSRSASWRLCGEFCCPIKASLARLDKLARAVSGQSGPSTGGRSGRPPPLRLCRCTVFRDTLA